MAQPFGQTGTADPITGEYFSWESPGCPFRVLLHLDAMDGLARDVLEHSQGLPVEVGGLLLGRVARGQKPSVWIERYKRVECEHRSGPNFALSEEELAGLEGRAAELSGDLNVVGFYRSHLRDGLAGSAFKLDAADRELIARYFKDPEDLFLLIGREPENKVALRAQFFSHGPDGTFRAVDPVFPFRGRAVIKPLPEGTVQPDPKEKTGRSRPLELPVGDRLGRLVPDFIPSGPAALPENPERPAREFFMEARPSPLFSSTEELGRQRGSLSRRWPLLAALLLVGGGAAFFLQQAGHHDAKSGAPAAADSVAVRPLGLYVDPSGPSWRISWNQSATALQGARGVQLFVRDGDDQNRIELSPQDLQSATYRYQAKGSDVTFRLEVTDSGGHVWAESFRLLKTSPKPADIPPAPAPVSNTTRPKAIRKVAPVVPSSIRPRIKSPIPVDVRVRVDAQGRVVSASPLTRGHSGLETFLAGRAVAAAKEWRFEPAREDGKPVPGTEIIHFNFER